MKFELPNLPYEYNDLAPHIDSKTMEIHHTKHHQAYINNLNNALEGRDELANMSLIELLTNLESLPQEIRTTVRNNGGGHYNHSLFWEIMHPMGIGPTLEMKEKIDRNFGSMEALKDEFSKAATGQFGSGWAWIVKDGEELRVVATPNQDTPLMSGLLPILGLDVWEHAYYLQYQNRRPDYINNWWNLINWKQVEKNLNAN